MKWMIYCLAVLFVSSLDGAAQTGKTGAAEREVRGTVLKWAEAVLGRDIKFLDQLFSDDLFVTTHDGKTRGKAEELEALKPSPNVKTVSVVNDDLRVKIYGNTAVVTAMTRMHFVVDAKDVKTSLRYTALFVKKTGRWRLVVLQTARAPQS